MKILLTIVITILLMSAITTGTLLGTGVLSDWLNRAANSLCNCDADNNSNDNCDCGGGYEDNQNNKVFDDTCDCKDALVGINDFKHFTTHGLKPRNLDGMWVYTFDGSELGELFNIFYNIVNLELTAEELKNGVNLFDRQDAINFQITGTPLILSTSWEWDEHGNGFEVREYAKSVSLFVTLNTSTASGEIMLDFQDDLRVLAIMTNDVVLYVTNFDFALLMEEQIKHDNKQSELSNAHYQKQQALSSTHYHLQDLLEIAHIQNQLSLQEAHNKAQQELQDIATENGEYFMWQDYEWEHFERQGFNWISYEWQDYDYKSFPILGSGELQFTLGIWGVSNELAASIPIELFLISLGG
jgi:hypothetical protein